MHGQVISDNEIYLLIIHVYIKSVLWRVAKSLSFIEDARYLKKILSSIIKFLKIHNSLMVLKEDSLYRIPPR